MAGFLLAPCGNVHLVEMYKQGKQDADMRVRKNTVGYVWRGNGLSEYVYIYAGDGRNYCVCCFRSYGGGAERNGYFRGLRSWSGDCSRREEILDMIQDMLKRRGFLIEAE